MKDNGKKEIKSAVNILIDRMRADFVDIEKQIEQAATEANVSCGIFDMFILNTYLSRAAAAGKRLKSYGTESEVVELVTAFLKGAVDNIGTHEMWQKAGNKYDKGDNDAPAEKKIPKPV